MSLRSILGIFAALLGLLGLTAGVIEWCLQILLLGPESGEALYTMAHLAWLGHIVGFGTALIVAGVAIAMPVKAPTPERAPQPAAAPPPLPAAPVPVVPREETRAAEDLWQSADAPFPAPPSIDHPSAGPSLWQSDQAPFPKVDVPEDDEEAARNEAANRRDA